MQILHGIGDVVNARQQVHLISAAAAAALSFAAGVADIAVVGTAVSAGQHHAVAGRKDRRANPSRDIHTQMNAAIDVQAIMPGPRGQPAAAGQRRVRFRPTPAAETSQAMEQLELAYLEARNDANINQLLLIPCVILDFLCIHPFRDGNGRMSRLLSLLLLYKNGYDAGKYVSFEEQINNYKAYYYEALRQSSEGWENNENSYFPFIENFLSTLYMCYKELDKRFAVVHGKKITKKARVEATVLNSLTPISKAEICRILPDVSPTTVEAVLGAMVKSGSIKRIGQARSARYIKAE